MWYLNSIDPQPADHPKQVQKEVDAVEINDVHLDSDEEMMSASAIEENRRQSNNDTDIEAHQAEAPADAHPIEDDVPEVASCTTIVNIKHHRTHQYVFNNKKASWTTVGLHIVSMVFHVVMNHCVVCEKIQIWTINFQCNGVIQATKC